MRIKITSEQIAEIAGREFYKYLRECFDYVEVENGKIVVSFTNVGFHGDPCVKTDFVRLVKKWARTFDDEDAIRAAAELEKTAAFLRAHVKKRG